MAERSEASQEPRPEERPEPPTDDAGGHAPDDQGAQPRAVPLHALETRDILVWCLNVFAAKAWEGMGLVPNPANGKVAKNLDGARLAIDAYAAVFLLVREGIDESPRREMETLLTNLRVNFVEKSSS